MRLLRWIALLVGLLALAQTLLLGVARRGGKPTLIAYAEINGRTTTLTRMSPDGSDSHPLAELPQFGTQLLWSPDGGWLAFDMWTRYREFDGPQLVFWSVSQNGRTLQPVADPNAFCETHAGWSPDGEWLALVCNWADPMLQLVVVRPDGSDLHEVARFTAPIAAVTFDWSPDSESLVFVDHGTHIYRAYLDGRPPELLLNLDNQPQPEGAIRTPIQAIFWLPDENDLLILDYANVFYRLTLDGSLPQFLNSDAIGRCVVDFSMKLAPNGRWLLAMVTCPNYGGISNGWVRLDTQTGDVLRLPVDPAIRQTNLAWSPDSDWIVFEQITPTSRNIARMRADGSDVQVLTGDSTVDALPAWSPPLGGSFHPVIGVVVGGLCLAMGVLLRRNGVA